MPKKLGVLVVTYNQLAKTRIWINNFYSKHIDNPYIKLLILDNHSTDNTYYTLKNEFPTLDIRLLKSNYGCTKGRNIGIAELFDLGCDIYCGFDPDVLIEDSDFFEKVVDFLNYHPDLDGFSPVLRFYEDMSIQGLGGRRGFLGVMKAVTKITADKNVHYIPGGSSIIRMSAFRKYGIYDNDFPPIGGQDYEWGYRATQSTGLLQYNPNLEVIHHHKKNLKCLDPVQKRWVFIGRTMFLRKHFTIGHLFRELHYLFYSLLHSNPRFVLSSYIEGLRKSTSPNSSNFSDFLEGDRKCYYQNPHESS